MFWNVLILSLILVGISFLGMAITIIIKKGGKFPETGVGHNPEMKKRGLSCAKTEELKAFQLQKSIYDTKGNTKRDPSDFSGGCAGCSCG